MSWPADGLMRYRQGPLIFRKGGRLTVYVPRDRVHGRGIRGVMARHGWRLASVSAAEGRDVGRLPPEPRA